MTIFYLYGAYTFVFVFDSLCGAGFITRCNRLWKYINGFTNYVNDCISSLSKGLAS